MYIFFWCYVNAHTQTHAWGDRARNVLSIETNSSDENTSRVEKREREYTIKYIRTNTASRSYRVCVYAVRLACRNTATDADTDETN